MKIKQLLLVGVASMALFSCSDKDDISVSQDEIKSLSVSLGGIKTKSTVVRKLKDQEGNLTGEEELQVSESELAPNLQAMSVWLYHHDEEWRKVERKQDEEADIPKDIEHGVSIDSWTS